MSDTWTQCRALFRTPASIFATPEERERGYVLRWTSPGTSRQDVVSHTYELRCTEESHTYVVRWEQRTITAGPWTEVDQ